MDYGRRRQRMSGIDLKRQRSMVAMDGENRMLEILYPSKKRLVLASLVSPWRKETGVGLKTIAAEDEWQASDMGARNKTVLRQRYRVQFKNPELEAYAMNVMAGTRSRKESSNLQRGPTTFSMACEGGGQGGGIGSGNGNGNGNGGGASSSSQPRQVPEETEWMKVYSAAKASNSAEVKSQEAAQVAAEFELLSITRQQMWKDSDKKRLDLLKKQQKPDVGDAFTRLSDDAEMAVESALYSRSRHKALVMHEQSNIEITGAVMECLRPGTWLNDEVINVYMELLKEREVREPSKFLRCHFFNTFFYNKLFKDKDKYDYKAVRRWTTPKKLGYSLIDCDKIFVPIHKDIHWCLGIINIREQKFEYLDSLHGIDEDALEVLSKYIVDEAKDKSGTDLDVSGWRKECPGDIPGQENGCDCGMFMIKYTDFYSRGDSLAFTQENMEYFRRRTVWEILRLKAT